VQNLNKMRTAEGLLNKLGVMNCTKRHLQIINDFLASGETDCKKLLDQLGGWDANDLAITERWLNER
jgi:hypothetical protein